MNNTSMRRCLLALGVFVSHAAEESVRAVHGGQLAPMCTSATATTPLTSSCGTSCQVSVTTNVFLQSVVITVSTMEVGSPALLNLNVTNTLSSASACATDVNTAELQVLDNLTANYYANFADYETVSLANRTIFPTFGLTSILTATDTAASDLFGAAISVSGDCSTMIIGAQDANGSSGKAYIFERQPISWSQVLEINDPNNTPNDSFGRAVAISHDGSVIAISRTNVSGTNAVYIYGYSPSTNQLTLYQSVAGTGSTFFGTQIALSASGQYLIVANNSTTSPQVLVYARQNSCAGLGTTWVLQQTLSTQSAFLGSIAISRDGTVIAIGVVPNPGTGQGIVDIYTLNNGTWSLAQTITASDGGANDDFGSALALSGNGKYLIVGAQGNGNGKGYEFVRRGTLWLQENTFTASVGTSFANSTAISADGSTVVFGNITAGANAGAVYVDYRSPDNTWTQQLIGVGTTTSSFLGSPVAISDDGAFIAASSTDFGIPGSVYMYSPIGSLISSDAIITGSLCVFNQATVNGDLYVTGSLFTNNFLVAGGVTPCIASDRQLKKDVNPLLYDLALEKINALRPVSFEWKHPHEHVGESTVGFIAQDVRKHFPHWVHEKQPTGADAACIPAGENALYIAITPEILTYCVAVIKQLHKDNAEHQALLYDLIVKKLQSKVDEPDRS